MPEFTKVLATDIILPNISVYRKYRDGVHCAYEVYSNKGYVMYDATASNTELDLKTNEIVPVNYYSTWVSCPLNIDFDNFPYVAVPRYGVDEKYIFGDVQTEHQEVIV